MTVDVCSFSASLFGACPGHVFRITLHTFQIIYIYIAIFLASGGLGGGQGDIFLVLGGLGWDRVNVGGTVVV